mmetsp:Transcript_5677/g.15901  ORF Transcript_5677/g.15901 Transcript_5677/m.15901 type:complete len:146 (-) Transcript_5677:118-555(-)
MLFSDEFRVVELNPDSKKFERVNRLVCTGSAAGAANVATDLILDINCEIFEVKQDDSLSVALMSSLDGKPDAGEYVPYVEGEGSVLDDYDYAMHGLVFDVQHDEGQRVAVTASFGGLLMKITGEQNQLDQLQNDMSLYVLVKQMQ